MTARFVDDTTQLNRNLIEQAWINLGVQIYAPALDEFAGYPQTCTCSESGIRRDCSILPRVPAPNINTPAVLFDLRGHRLFRPPSGYHLFVNGTAAVPRCGVR